MENINENILFVFFPGVLFDKNPWTNRQHISTRVAKYGFNVIYVEPSKHLFVQLLVNLKKKLELIGTKLEQQ